RDQVAATDRRQVVDPFRTGRRAPFRHRLPKVIAAWHEQEEVGIDVGDRIPGRLSGRLSVPAEEIPAAGAPDLVRNPVADGERWIEPLQPDHPRTAEPALAPRLGCRLDGLEALAQSLD